jgi:hypothetical protein
MKGTVVVEPQWIRIYVDSVRAAHSSFTKNNHFLLLYT